MGTDRTAGSLHRWLDLGVNGWGKGVGFIEFTVGDVLDEGEPAIGRTIGLECGLVGGGDAATADALIVCVGLIRYRVAADCLVKAMAQ